MTRQGIVRKLASTAIITTMLLITVLSSLRAEEQSINDRMFHHRAIETVVWAMPLLNFKQYRDGHKDLGVGRNDIAYYSKIQDWKFQTATPSHTSRVISLCILMFK